MTEAAVETEIAQPFNRNAYPVVDTVMSLNSDDYRVRIDKIKDTKDQELLKIIAKIDPNSKVREEAAKKITDQKDLLEIIKEELVFYVRLTIVQKITDQKILKEIAGSDDYCWPLREEAIKGITDQDYLKEIINKELISSLRLAAVNGITDQDYLKKLVETIDCDYVKHRAVGKITDQDYLKKIVLTRHDDIQLRDGALEGITDQKILLEIAMEGGVFYNRRIAVKKITDQDYLKKIVENVDNDSLRDDAVRKITDQDYLKKLVLINKSSSNFREAALNNLEDEKTLACVALKDSSRSVRLEAVRKKKIKNQKTLAHIARHDSSSRVRFEAALQIKDSKIFYDVLAREGEFNVAAARIKRSNPHNYLEILSSSPSLKDIQHYSR